MRTPAPPSQGIDYDELTAHSLCLFTACVQVGAFSVMISALRRTSTQALSGTYIYGIGWIIATGFAFGLLAAIFGAASRSEGVLMVLGALAMGYEAEG